MLILIDEMNNAIMLKLSKRKKERKKETLVRKKRKEGRKK